MNIYVGNLNFRLAEPDLIKMFALYGDVTNVKIIRDRETGRSKGFAFVEMPNDEDARRAIQSLHDTESGDRRIVVNEAAPAGTQEKKPYSGGGNSGGGGGGYNKGGGFGGGGGGGYKKPYSGGGGGGDKPYRSGDRPPARNNSNERYDRNKSGNSQRPNRDEQPRDDWRDRD